MYFSIALTISVLLCNRVIFSDGSFLRDITLSNEDDPIGEFFEETNIFSQDRESWILTVIGTSNDQLQQTKSLLTTFPHFVGTDAKELCESVKLAPRTLIVYYLASLEEEHVKKAVEGLANCKENRLYFIFEGTSVKTVDIEATLRIANEKLARLPFLIHHSKKSVKLYGYSKRPECLANAELLRDWTPRVNTRWREDWQERFEHSRCPISVGTKNHPPWMSLAEDANGAKRMVGGLESKIIATLAQKMNFAPLVQEFKASDEVKDQKTVAIVSSCAAGNTAMGIAHIRPTHNVVKAVDISYSYSQECIVWCVPRITHWKRNIILSEFSWSTWVLIGLTFLASLVVEKIARNTQGLNRGKANKLKCFSIILNLIGSTLGNPIVYQPIAIGGKVLLIVYLCYSTVITTAYKTSLSSMLTLDNLESSIVDIEGIIKENITTGGDVYRKMILEDQIGESEWIPELVRRYVIEPNISKALRQISHEKNMAYLASVSDINYHNKLLAKAGEQLSFDVLDGCVLTHNNVIILPKSSQLTESIDQVMLNMDESGLIDYWFKDSSDVNRPDYGSARSSEIINTEGGLYRFTRVKFYQIFWIYCLALTFCTLVFLGELLVHKFKFLVRN